MCIQIDTVSMGMVSGFPSGTAPGFTPGRHVGAEEEEGDGEPFAEKMERLTGELGKQLAESYELENEIRKNLNSIGYAV